MKSKHILLVSLLIFNIGLCGFLVFHSMTREKLGYVNLQKVFSEFDYKKEMELKLKRSKELNEKTLDSVLTELKNFSIKLEKEAKPAHSDILHFRQQQSKFQELKKKLDQESMELTSTYDDQILKQMNQYIMDFGKSHHYKFIFGSDGTGNIMFARESDELTEEVIAFINKKYKGIN